jgi:hypothetical protein
MNSPDQFLLVVDFPGIKGFVFGTDRLVEIRGGSGILDHLNREVLPGILAEKLGTDNVDCVYAGGGAGQFLVRAPRERIDEAVARLRRQCREESGGGLRLVTVLVPYSGDYVQATRRAYQELRRRKEEEPPLSAVSDHVGLLRDCDSCAGSAAELVKHGEGKLLLCPVCAAKTRFGQETGRGLWAEFARTMERLGHDREAVLHSRPADFEKVGKASTVKRGHVGLIYADGNAMGRLVKEIDSPETFRFFSQTVDTAIREACHEALDRRCVPNGRVGTVIPALILLLGGDDLLVYTTADMALPLAMEAARLFEAKTGAAFRDHPFFQDRLAGKGLTISLGVAFGRANTPFSMLLNQAEELLKSAKVRGSLDARCTGHYAPGYVDYHFAARYNHVRALPCREEQQVLRPEGSKSSLHLTNRPYSLEDMEDLWDQARTISESGIPRSRLKRLGMAPARGWVGANLEFYALLGRIKDSRDRPVYRKSLLWNALHRFGCRLDEAPWVRRGDDWATVVTDLVELSEITPKTSEAGYAPVAH